MSSVTSLGREHINYEIRSALEGAAVGLSKSLSNAFGSAPTTTPADRPATKAAKQISSPIKATLKKKGWYEGQYGRNEITFTVEFANASGKNIRAFDGRLTFHDLLDNEILGSKVAINDPVRSGESLSWDGKLDYNQFMDRHERLRNAEIQNTKVVFDVKRILFEDGEVKD